MITEKEWGVFHKIIRKLQDTYMEDENEVWDRTSDILYGHGFAPLRQKWDYDE